MLTPEDAVNRRFIAMAMTSGDARTHMAQFRG